jgi:Ca-activated chloride channel family protein
MRLPTSRALQLMEDPMHPSPSPRFGALSVAGVALAMLAVACSSPAAESTAPTASPSPSVEASVEPSDAANGEASLDAPAEVEAGAEFDIDWTGPDAQGDYVTIVAAGATEWTNEPYFYTATNDGTGTLTAPTADGAYVLWYVSGADEAILARVAIGVTPFEGALLGPDEVEAGTEFEVSWNGPDGPGDYVTIVAEGADRWTNEPYFYTTVGDTGTLIAPVEDGDYELWYVAGADDTVFATRPITVTPYEVTLDAPDQVAAGADFDVTWTGPDGPSDYITIVPAGSAEGAYLDYEYTTTGSPVTLTAPTEPGNYEIWYASDRVDGTFESIEIVVT